MAVGHEEEEEEEELDEAQAPISPLEERGLTGLSCTESAELDLGGELVLCIPEVFCFLAVPIEQRSRARKDNSWCREDQQEVGDSDIDAANMRNVAGPVDTFTEWRPCTLILTEQALRLVRKSPSEAPSVGSSSTSSTKASDEQCFCNMPLVRIVDVASSVCIFGSMLEKEEDQRIRSLSEDLLANTLSGSDSAAEAADMKAASDEAPGQRTPASSVEDGDSAAAKQQDGESAAERRRRLRKTHSKFNKILRRVPQSDLQSMLRHVGPYEFKAGAGVVDRVAEEECVHRCGISEQQQATGDSDRGTSASSGTVVYEKMCSGDGHFDGWCGDVHVADMTSPDCAQLKSFGGMDPGEERLKNGVAIGTFELPPIPLARLPEARLGLPVKNGKKDRRQRYPNTHGGLPLCDYDESNCQPHQLLNTAIPPLPPSSCRLPCRTHREMLSQRAKDNVSFVVESPGTPYPNVVIVWTTSSVSLAKCSGTTRRLQQGTPILLSFVRKEDASSIEDALLHHRARCLDESTGSASTGGDSNSTHASASANREPQPSLERTDAHPAALIRGGPP